MATRKAKESEGFTAEEKAAMKERAREAKKGAKADGEQDLLDKIAEMEGTDRELAEAIHAIVKEAAPGLSPKTWYGMPAYAKGGKVVCFFQASAKFKARYATLGFNDAAALDDGAMWPTAFAVTELNDAVSAKIAALVARAAGA
ncbi:MAG: DUF1801 domain-containing protein [Myxococcota bacterium]